MFDNPLEILPFLFAIVALVVAVKAMNQIAELRKRLDRMEAAARRQARAATASPNVRAGHRAHLSRRRGRTAADRA